MLDASQLNGELVGFVFCSMLQLLEALVEILCVPDGFKLSDNECGAAMVLVLYPVWMTPNPL